MNHQTSPLLTGLIIGCGILTRLVPHFPNFSPEIVFALYLGIKSPKALVYVNIFLMAIISDFLLGWQNPHFSSFGSWTFFTYSALLVIGWCGMRTKSQNLGRLFMMTACLATVAYWIWTNFGTWLIEGLYPHTLTGFVSCYTLALPFLANSLAASIAWCATIVLCEHYFPKNKQAVSQTH